jgi:hypothetical protein
MMTSHPKALKTTRQRNASCAHEFAPSIFHVQKLLLVAGNLLLVAGNQLLLLVAFMLACISSCENGGKISSESWQYITRDSWSARALELYK